MNKKIFLNFVILFSLVCSCGIPRYPILTSTDSKGIIDRKFVQCAWINEWNMTQFMSNKKHPSCWCLMPMEIGMLGQADALMTFRLTSDKLCDRNVKFTKEKLLEELFGDLAPTIDVDNYFK